MKFTIIFLSLFMALTSSVSFACDKVNFGYVSKHYTSTNQGGGEWNESNEGLGCVFENNFAIQVYENSYFEQSVTAYYFLDDVLNTNLFNTVDVNFGWQMGVVTGYPEYDVLPYILPRLDFTYKRVSLSTLFLWHEGIAFGLEIKL